MGAVASLKLVNGSDLALFQAGYLEASQIRKLKVVAQVNPEIYPLLIPEIVKQQLGLRTVETRSTQLIDQAWLKAEITGYVQVQFENRLAIADAYVLPNQTEVVIGRSLLLAMDVLIDSSCDRLIVNPASPDIARMLLMSCV